MGHYQTVLFGLLIALLTGCSTTMQARDVQSSRFLGEYRSLLQTGPEGGALLVYTKPTANWSAYKKVVLKPVIVWDGLSSKLDHQQRHQLKRLAGSFKDQLHMKLSKDYEVVEQSTAGVMVIEVALTDAEESWVVPAFLAKTVPQVQPASMLWTLGSGKGPFAGEITAEFKIHDAQTGELLAAGIDRRVGGRTPIDGEILNSWGDVKNSLEFWTDAAAYRLCVLRSGAGCVEPKV